MTGMIVKRQFAIKHHSKFFNLHPRCMPNPDPPVYYLYAFRAGVAVAGVSETVNSETVAREQSGPKSGSGALGYRSVEPAQTQVSGACRCESVTAESGTLKKSSHLWHSQIVRMLNLYAYVYYLYWLLSY